MYSHGLISIGSVPHLFTFKRYFELMICKTDVIDKLMLTFLKLAVFRTWEIQKQLMDTSDTVKGNSITKGSDTVID